MVEEAVNVGRGGHGIFEDLIPLRKDEIGSDHRTAALVAFGQSCSFSGCESFCQSIPGTDINWLLMVTAQSSKKHPLLSMEERFLRRSLSRKEPDLDPGPSGRDRGNLQEGVFAKKLGDCFGALCALRSDMSD